MAADDTGSGCMNRNGQKSVGLGDHLTPRDFVSFIHDGDGGSPNVLGQWHDQQVRKGKLVNRQSARLVLFFWRMNAMCKACGHRTSFIAMLIHQLYFSARAIHLSMSFSLRSLGRPG